MPEPKSCPKCHGQMVPGKFMDGKSATPSLGWESDDGEQWFDSAVYRCRKCSFLEFYASEEE